MMIGPEPITSTDFRSGRLGMVASPCALRRRGGLGGSSPRASTVHQLAELGEQAGRIVRPRRRLRVVLHREGRRVYQPQALDYTVVEVHVRDLRRTEVSRERA